MYWKNIYKILLAILLFILIGYFLYFFYFFPIKTVSTDENYIKKAEILTVINQSLGKIFLFEKNNIKNTALSFDNNIKNVFIERESLGGIKVYIEEYEAIAIWCGGDYEYFTLETDCYYIDQGGYIYSKLEEKDISLKESLPKIFGYFEEVPLSMSFEQENFVELKKIVTEMSYISGKLILAYEENDITLFTDAGKILLPRSNSKDSLENAIIFLKSNRGKTFEYIDARYGNSIFFK